MRSTHIFASLFPPNLKGKKGEAGRVNCFDHYHLLFREDMAATCHKVVGRIIFSREEFHSWLRENLPVLNGMGMRLNKAVYKEVYKALSECRDDLVAIVPQFDRRRRAQAWGHRDGDSVTRIGSES
jgi:hypothetical protein